MKEIYRFPENFLKGESINIRQNPVKEHFPLHWHKFYEMEYILEGSGTYTINGTAYNAKPGSMFFSTYMDFHEISADKELKIISIKFNEVLVDASLTPDLYSSIVVESFDDMLIMKLLHAYNSPLRHNDIYMENLLTCVLVELISSHSSSVEHKSLDETTFAIRKAMQYIHFHFLEDISAVDVAKKFSTSPNYFSTLFKKYTGTTIKQHITEHRIDYAKRLLLYSDMPITVIGFESGFNTFSSFFRAFCEITGMSPSKFKMTSK